MKRALIVGCAANVWDDIAAAQRLGNFAAVYCVKLAGVHWPGMFQTWVGLHPEYMDGYEAQRAALGYPNGYEIVAPPVGEYSPDHDKPGRIMSSGFRRVSYRWPGMNASASSGIYAAKVALDDGYERVVLAGIPMTKEAGHFTRNAPWLQRDSFINGFDKSLPHLMGRVKSMSGYTMERLGAATAEWLCGSGDPAADMGEMPALKLGAMPKGS